MAIAPKGKNSSASSDAQKDNKNRKGLTAKESKSAPNASWNKGMTVKGNPGNKNLPK